MNPEAQKFIAKLGEVATDAYNTIYGGSLTWAQDRPSFASCMLEVTASAHQAKAAKDPESRRKAVSELLLYMAKALEATEGDI